MHSLVAGLPGYIGGAGAFVLHSEKVDTAKIEGVTQLAACRVGFVVRKSKFAFIAYQAAGYATQLISIAAFGGRRLVNIGQEARNNVFDTVGTAEGAD